MGFLETITGSFERDETGLRLELPRSFQWGDGKIPVRVTLQRSSGSGPEQISAFKFTVVDDEDEMPATDVPGEPGTGVKFEWQVEGPFNTGESDEASFEFEIPVPQLGPRDPDRRPPYERRATGYMEHKLLSLVVGVSPQSIERYRVTVETVDGGDPERTSRLIQQGTGTAFGIGAG